MTWCQPAPGPGACTPCPSPHHRVSQPPVTQTPKGPAEPHPKEPAAATVRIHTNSSRPSPSRQPPMAPSTPSPAPAPAASKAGPGGGSKGILTASSSASTSLANVNPADPAATAGPPHGDAAGGTGTGTGTPAAASASAAPSPGGSVGSSDSKAATPLPRPLSGVSPANTVQLHQLVTGCRVFVDRSNLGEEARKAEILSIRVKKMPRVPRGEEQPKPQTEYYVHYVEFNKVRWAGILVVIVVVVVSSSLSPSSACQACSTDPLALPSTVVLPLPSLRPMFIESWLPQEGMDGDERMELSANTSNMETHFLASPFPSVSTNGYPRRDSSCLSLWNGHLQPLRLGMVTDTGRRLRAPTRPSLRNERTRVYERRPSSRLPRRQGNSSTRSSRKPS